jgi:hypothetical protein
MNYCKICQLACSGPESYSAHLKGQKHKRQLNRIKIIKRLEKEKQNKDLYFIDHVEDMDGDLMFENVGGKEESHCVECEKNSSDVKTLLTVINSWFSLINTSNVTGKDIKNQKYEFIDYLPIKIVKMYKKHGVKMDDNLRFCFVEKQKKLLD